MYLPDLQQRIKERNEQEEKRQAKDLAALRLDMHGREEGNPNLDRGQDQEEQEDSNA